MDEDERFFLEKLWELKTEQYKSDIKHSVEVARLQQAEMTEDNVQDDITQNRQFDVTTVIAIVFGSYSIISSLILITFYYHIL
jgi:hypothetical protein